jgi:hypothetical protein
VENQPQKNAIAQSSDRTQIKLFSIAIVLNLMLIHVQFLKNSSLFTFNWIAKEVNLNDM